MANKNMNRPETLNVLGMRPVSQVFHQIRYWSALDDPNEQSGIICRTTPAPSAVR